MSSLLVASIKRPRDTCPNTVGLTERMITQLELSDNSAAAAGLIHPVLSLEFFQYGVQYAKNT